ncbi:uncharacterized protein L3040_001009 [Drepanopeziza brunnea f. sp. 'multigermtubi']|uniref:uncharacterized protein n=1 Tax=Drepanopeziza brunnea f. sp. 'multigermtubi' TaxID=698441 RepID=UPI002397B4A0|nr:hypothetical protein L3040_001009 [Drepanopeziza brunnea f. sp. 'multigermtubi']
MRGLLATITTAMPTRFPYPDRHLSMDGFMAQIAGIAKANATKAANRAAAEARKKKASAPPPPPEPDQDNPDEEEEYESDEDMQDSAEFHGFPDESPAEKRARLAFENDERRKEEKHRAEMAALLTPSAPLAVPDKVADDYGESSLSL